MNLSEFSLKRPVTTLMLTICALVVGVVALDRLPIEQLPSISSSGITARVQYNNSSPEEIERLVVLPLEQTLGTLNNIDRISSSSERNQGEVRVDFKAGTDMDLANMEMREKLDQARALLPPDVDRVSLRRWQSDQRAIIDANLTWRGDGDRLLDLIQKVIQPRLLRLNGVVNVVIDDFEEKQLIVELDQERLQAHNISLGSLGWQLNENNTNISLGRVMDGDQRYMARAIGEFTRAEEIASLPLMGGQFRLSDIGEINYGYPEKRRYERLNGTDALELEIFKASTANVVEVGEVVVAELQAIEDEYDGELELFIDRNRAESVLKEAGTLFNSALLGAFLAMTIIFLFLRNIRSTIVIALAIPTSALCVFIGMYVAREVFESTITLNMVSMMGLMLAVGMLVDPAVVVLESIFPPPPRRRPRRRRGRPRRQPRSRHGRASLGADDDLRFRALLLPLRWPLGRVDERRWNRDMPRRDGVDDRLVVADPAGVLAAAARRGRALRPLAQAAGHCSRGRHCLLADQRPWLERLAGLVGPLVRADRRLNQRNAMADYPRLRARCPSWGRARLVLLTPRPAILVRPLAQLDARPPLGRPAGHGSTDRYRLLPLRSDRTTRYPLDPRAPGGYVGGH